MPRLWIGIVFLVLGGIACAEEGPNGAGMSATVLGKMVTAGSQQQLNLEVMEVIIDDYAAKNGVTVTPAELDSFVTMIKEQQKQMLPRLEQRKAKLTAELKLTTLSAEDREKKTKRLELTERLIRAQGQTLEMMKGQEELVEQTRRTMGEKWVKAWKVGQALYNKYGGRVVFGEFGPKPVDAWYAYIKEKKGEIEFADAATEAGFLAEFKEDASRNYVPEAAAKNVMEKPWWTAVPPVTD